jgi:hypothetical protein
MKTLDPDFVRRLRYSHDSLAEADLQAVGAPVAARRQAERRKHLTCAMRAVPELTPGLAAIIESVRQRVAPSYEVEAYVQSAPEVQAVSIGGGGGNMVAMVLTSGLVGLMQKDELEFVIGHELGHYIFGHYGYPDPEMAQTEAERLNLRHLQRAAEISADRVGLIACKAVDSCFWCMLKSASGLPRDLLRCDVAAYLDQARALGQMGGSEFEMDSSHPMFTVRVRALLWFQMSEVYQEWLGECGTQPIKMGDVDARIERDLAAATGFRLAEVNERAVQEAFMWGVVALLVADNRLDKGEQALLARTFGPDRANEVVSFLRESGPDSATARLEASLRGVKLLPHKTRAALHADLEQLSAQASGVSETRARLLRVIADRLSLATETGV